MPMRHDCSKQLPSSCKIFQPTVDATTAAVLSPARPIRTRAVLSFGLDAGLATDFGEALRFLAHQLAKRIRCRQSDLRALLHEPLP